MVFQEDIFTFKQLKSAGTLVFPVLDLLTPEVSICDSKQTFTDLVESPDTLDSSTQGEVYSPPHFTEAHVEATSGLPDEAIGTPGPLNPQELSRSRRPSRP